VTGRPRWLPHGPFARAILIRGGGIWAAVRIAMLMVGNPADGATSPALAYLVSAGVATVVTILVRLDIARRHEQLFLADLGIRPEMLTTLAALPPLILEVVLAAFGSSGLPNAISALSR